MSKEKSSSKSFDEKERENILIRLVKRYEGKVSSLDENISELNNKKNNAQELAYAINLIVKYWLAMIGVNLVLFPAIGYFQGNIITGISMWIVSSTAICVTCLGSTALKKYCIKSANNLNIKIENEEEKKKDYEKDLTELKKHITPAYIEYDFVQNSSELEVQRENIITYVSEKTEDLEVGDSSISGPTLVKRNIKRRK